MNPLLLTDYYKTEHHKMYPPNTTLIYSNLTPRRSRVPGVDKVVVFGIQHAMKLITGFFQVAFFTRDIDDIVEEYERHIPIKTTHLRELHKLGYLPIHIKALPEGTLCPIGVPLLTIRNTHPKFYWLTNYLETWISAMTWQMLTSATIAYEYKKLLLKAARETGGDESFVQWQGHDFSMRGMSSIESAIVSGMGHLTSFTGTDTIPAIYTLEGSYMASGLIGGSVPATEHSVMSMGTMEDEIGTFQRLLDLYPTGILSVVSDTWDLWKVVNDILPKLKKKILARDGKLVIRPDSGDPVDILCGLNTNPTVMEGELSGDIMGGTHLPEYKGLIELLWDIFGGTINERGYKQLDPHIGAIYGDSITLSRAKDICDRLKAKGFASTNVVLGIGSYTYQYNTRDTFGFAVKATYGELKHGDPIKGDAHGAIEARELFKDPITDDGTKRSARGLLQVYEENGQLKLKQQCTWEEERQGLLQTVFKDSRFVTVTTLEEIRERLEKTLSGQEVQV